MRIPVDWLSESVPNELSLRELADALTNMGLEVEAIEDAVGAAVFDIKVTPNRGDCLSVEGMARELATALCRPMLAREPRVVGTGPPVGELAEVMLDDPVLCPRYSARVVRAVKIGPSPEWAQRRLEQCGMRPINNVVDATNLTMLELGQPLHAFDSKLVQGKPTIIVRRALPGERLVTIDGEERALPTEVLVIADPSGPIALAGIMGGVSTEVHDGTTEVLLESAHFHPSVVRKGARALQMSTEASYRFERTVDPGGTVRALDRACELISEFSGGQVEVARGVVDAYPVPVEEVTIELRPERANALLGTQLTAEEMAEHLRRLQLKVTIGDKLVVRVPTFRQDLKLEIDLVEEVARAHGYQNIPESLPASAAGVGRQAPELAFEDQVRQVLRGSGLSETVTSSLEGPETLAKLGLPEDDPWAQPVLLSNPKTRDRSQMRTNLLTSLLEVVAVNRRRGVSEVSVFDLGMVFLPADEDSLPHQPQHLGIVGTGRRWHGVWAASKELVIWDFLALKGVVEQVLRAVAGVEATYLAPFEIDSTIVPGPPVLPIYLSGQRALVLVAGTTIGHLGQISDAVRNAWDLPDPVYAAELDLDAVRRLAVVQPAFRPPSRFPASARDVAFVLPRGVAAKQAEQAIRESAGPHLEELQLFDVYEGKPLPEGYRNLAFSLIFRREDDTLTDEEVEAAMERVRTALRKHLGATIRA